MAIVNDRRSAEQVAQTKWYVNATDRFLSGWGKAPCNSYYCIACPSLDVAEEVMKRMGYRSEMKRVAIAERPRRPGKGDHLSISWHTSFTFQPKFN